MKKVIFFLFLLIFSIHSIFCQNLQYAKELIKNLASPEFCGRGYVNKGDLIAAKYISKQFKHLKVKNFENNYFQTYSFPVNSLPKFADVSLSNKKLEPGVDYLVASVSSSCKGKFPIVWINKNLVDNPENFKNTLSSNLKNKFLALDTTGIKDKEILKQIDLLKKENQVNARGIIEIISGNLVFRASQKKWNYPLVQIKKDKINALQDSVIEVKIKNKFFKHYKTQNVIAYVEGKTDTFIVFTAHYDHLGKMGKSIYFPGAHDNASGTATVIDLARHFASLEEKPYYSIAFMLFSGEEAGLCGSTWYSNHPYFPLSKIRFDINLDLVGSGEDGLSIINGKMFNNEFALLDSINKEKHYFENLVQGETSSNSDHYPFQAKGVHAFFVLTRGSYKEYHNIFDRAEALPLPAYDNVFHLLTDFVDALKTKK